MQAHENITALLAECDKCVMCGLCLPHCPTYTLTKDENESPRGRISLVRAVLSEQLELSGKTQAHLEHCLSCRACERMCPSAVNYSKIINGIRQQFPGDLPFPVSNKNALKRLNSSLWLFQKSGLHFLLRSMKPLLPAKLARKFSLLPAITRQGNWKESYASKTPCKGKVQLFTGCISNSVDHQTLRDAVKVLTHLGYEVMVPAQQNCCGAMDRHHGNSNTADELADQNREAFNKTDLPVISLHSGCSVTLQDALANKVVDVCDFIINEDLQLTFKPLDEQVVIHTPCTKRNVMRNENNVASVLRNIPGIKLSELPTNLSCCGAAGSYMLEYPEKAEAIREPSLEAIKASGATTLVTSNIGCAMHLAAGLRERGIHIKVMHPANLIAKLLVRRER